MKKRTLYILCIYSFFIGLTNLPAQERRSEMQVEFRVNSSYIDPDYANNAQRLQEIVANLQALLNDTTLSDLSISFYGSASPEGSDQINKRLARQRLAALEKAVRSQVRIPDSLITRDDGYIPWDYLKAQVEASDLPYREEIVLIINSESQIVRYRSNQHIDDRILRLQKLDGGRAWQELDKRFFRPMRNACVVLVSYRRLMPASITCPARETHLCPSAPQMPVHIPVPPLRTRKPFYIALKTNALYDLLLVPNVGVEWYAGKNWSVAANWMYAWWSNGNKHRYWRVYGGDIALRKWFGQAAEAKPLTGHHIGIYAQALTYDFKLGEVGYMGGDVGGNLFDRASYAAGIEYGYSLPLTRKLNIDFSIGVGYLGGKYHEYQFIDDCHVWQATKQRHWFGPTKVEASLVWLLGHGNHNRQKGGKR